MPEDKLKRLAQVAIEKNKSEGDFISVLRENGFDDKEVSQALGYYNGLNVKKKDLSTPPSSLVEASVVSKSRPANAGYGLEYPTQVPKAEVKQPTSDGKDLLRGKSTPKVEGVPDITEAPPSYDWRKAAIAGRIIEMDNALKNRADILDIQKSQTEQPQETGGRQYELAVRDNTSFTPNIQDLSALFDAQEAKYTDNLSAVKKLGEQVYGADAVATQTWDDGIERVSPEQTERMLNEGLVEMDKHNKYLDNLVRSRQQEVGSVSFDNMLGAGFKSIASGLIELAPNQPLPVSQITALENEITTRAANLNQGVSSENVDKSIVELLAEGEVGDGLTKLKNSVYQQIPQVALTIVAPEYALPTLAASAAGSTWGDIKYRPDLNTAEKLTLAVGAGVAEYAFEKLFMGDIKAARRSLGLDEVGNLPVDEVKKRLGGVVDVAKNFGEEAIEEGGVEATNQILANIIANEEYNPIAIADAMIVGGVSGGSTVGVTTALAKGASAIGTHRTAGVKVKLNKESRQIQTLLQDPNISPQERSALEQKLNDVIKQGVDLANDELKFYEQFDEADANEMLSINQQVKNNIGAINKSTNEDSKAILMEQTRGLLERKKEIEQKYYKDDSENEQRVSGQERIREESEQAQPEQTAGQEQVSPSGDVQETETEQVEIPKTGTEVTDDASIDNVLSQVWKSKSIPQERKTTIAKSIASLKKAVPKKKVILHTTRESFEDAVGIERGKGQGAAGANMSDAIHINLTDTNSNTALHEVLHDVYAEQNKGYVDKISDKIFRAVSNDTQLKAKYVNFLRNYEQGEMSEEFFAEFWSDVASGEVEIEFVKDYIQDAKDAVAKFIGKITGVEPKLSDRDFVKLMEAYVKDMRTNEAPNADIKNVKESDTRFQIIGDSANLNEIERQNLSIAKRLERDGVSSDDIYLQTGWEKAADGKWRMESDYGSVKTITAALTLYSDNFGNHTAYPIASVYDNDDLYQRYERVAKARVVFFDSKDFLSSAYAAYNPEINAIFVNLNNIDHERKGDTVIIRGGRANESYSRSIIHEVQHIAQTDEGFGAGGDTEQIRRVVEQYLQRGKFVPENSSDRKILEFIESPTGDKLIRDSRGRQDQVGFIVDEIYNRISGEVEAINAEDRSLMTDAERRLTPISKTERVDRGEQIVLPKFQLNTSDVSKAFDFYIKSATNKKEFVNGVRSMYDITISEANQLYDRAKAFFKGYRTGFGVDYTSRYSPSTSDGKSLLNDLNAQIQSHFEKGGKPQDLFTQLAIVINNATGGGNVTANNLMAIHRANKSSGKNYSQEEEFNRLAEQVVSIYDSLSDGRSEAVVEQMGDIQQDVAKAKEREDAAKARAAQKRKDLKKALVEYKKAIDKARSKQRTLSRRLKKKKIENGIKSTYGGAIETALGVQPHLLKAEQLGEFIRLMDELNSAIGGAKFIYDTDLDSYEVLPWMKDVLLPSHRNAVDLNNAASLFLSISNAEAVARKNKSISNAAKNEALATGRPFQEVYDEIYDKVSRGISLRNSGFSNRLIKIADDNNLDLNTVGGIDKAFEILSSQLEVEYAGKIDAIREILTDVIQSYADQIADSALFQNVFGGYPTSEYIAETLDNLNLAELIRFESFIRNYVLNGSEMGFGFFSERLASKRNLREMAKIEQVKNKDYSLRKIPVITKLNKVRRYVSGIFDNLSLVFRANMPNIPDRTLAKIKNLIGADTLKRAVIEADVAMNEYTSRIRDVINDFLDEGINVNSFENQAMSQVFTVLRQRPTGVTQADWFVSVRKTVNNALDNPQRITNFGETEAVENAAIKKILTDIFGAVDKASQTPIDDALALFPEHIGRFVDEFVSIHDNFFAQHQDYTDKYLGRNLVEEDNYTPLAWASTKQEDLEAIVMQKLRSQPSATVKNVAGSSIQREGISDSMEMRFDFININQSSLNEAIYTSYVAPALYRFDATINSPELVAMIPDPEIRGNIRAAVLKLVEQPVKAQSVYQGDAFLNNSARVLQSYFTVKMLGSLFTQIPKQSIVVINSMRQMTPSGIQTSMEMLTDLVGGKITKKRKDGKGVVSAVLKGDKANVFEDFKSYLTESQLELLKKSPVYFRDYDNALIGGSSSRFVERIASKKLRRAMGVREGLQSVSLGTLTGTDKVATIISWFGFYRSYFDREGIEWQGWDAEPNLDAVSYADLKVDKDHSVSTTHEGSMFQAPSKMIADKRLAAVINIIRFSVAPFAIFAVNKARNSYVGFNQAVFGKNKKARLEGAGTVAGNIGEAVLYAHIVAYLSVLLINTIGEILFGGDDEDKKWEDAYSDYEISKMRSEATKRGIMEGITPAIAVTAQPLSDMMYMAYDELMYKYDKGVGNWVTPPIYSSSDEDAERKDKELYMSINKSQELRFAKDENMIDKFAAGLYEPISNLWTLSEDGSIRYRDSQGRTKIYYAATEQDRGAMIISETAKLTQGVLAAVGIGAADMFRPFTAKGRNAKLFKINENEEALKRLLNGDSEMFKHMIVSKAEAHLKESTLGKKIKLSQVVDREDIVRSLNNPKQFYDYKRMIDDSMSGTLVDGSMLSMRLKDMSEALDMTPEQFDAAVVDLIIMIIAYNQDPSTSIKSFVVNNKRINDNLQDPERGENAE